jgi:hypothetical protein
VVQRRLGYKSAVNTLDTYSHLWPDSEDRTREVVDDVLGRSAAGTAAEARREPMCPQMCRQGSRRSAERWSAA